MKYLSLTSVCVLSLSVVGCDSADPEKPPTQPATHTDAGQVTEPSTSDEDAGLSPEATCDDDPTTPGNDCSSAVGCHNELTCDLSTNSCCVPGLDIPAVACVEGRTCEMGARANCDGPEDCSGMACCVDIVAGTASCASQDVCPSGTQLCHTDDDCEAGKTCKRGQLFTWWGVCG